MVCLQAGVLKTPPRRDPADACLLQPTTTIFASTSRTTALSRTSTLAKKTRKRSAGASRYGYRYSREHRKRRASAPILSPPQPNFIRVPSPVSRSAETVARLGLSQSPSPQPSPSKSVSFSTEAEEVFIARPDSLYVPRASNVSFLVLVGSVCWVVVMTVR